MKKHRRRADRVAATLAETGNDGEQQAARRLVGCRGCNMNFFRDVCTRALIPSHYRVKPGKKITVGLCSGSRQRFRKPRPQPDDVPWR
jgi:hypothetical protein